MHLFDAMMQKSISSEQHDFVLDSVFDVQDEIGRQVVESLRKRFPPAVPKSRDRYSSDPEAYNEFMAGLRESYSDRPDTLESAIQHLSTAIERDPEFALAQAWLSYVLTNVHFSFDPRPARLEKAEHHCRRALMLDPALPEGHLARAFILWSPAKGFQHAEALEALEQVLAVQPNLEQAHNRISSICLHIGRLQDSRIAYEHAQRSNPKTRSRNLEFFYLYSGDFERAEETGEAWFRDRPRHLYALFPPTTSAFRWRPGSRRTTVGDGSRAFPVSPDHQPSRNAARPAESDRPGARVCSRTLDFHVPSATRIIPITKSPVCMRYSDKRSRRWHGWNAASTPVSLAGPFSKSTHTSNPCVRKPNSNGSSLTSNAITLL